MQMQRINYDDLNAKQKEIYNFQKCAAILADYGFNCIKLADDWQGADFLAHHFDGTTTLKVQLKGRLTIDSKYVGQDLWMNFPVGETWYIVPHDELVRAVGERTNWLNTKSWQEHGGYSSNNPSSDLLAELHPFALTGGAADNEQAEEPTADDSETTYSNLAAGPVANNKAERSSGGERLPNSISIRKNLVGRGEIRRFEFNGVRYEVPHDELVRIAGEVTPWLSTSSWVDRGGYSTSAPSKDFLDRLRPYALNFSG